MVAQLWNGCSSTYGFKLDLVILQGNLNYQKHQSMCLQVSSYLIWWSPTGMMRPISMFDNVPPHRACALKQHPLRNALIVAPMLFWAVKCILLSPFYLNTRVKLAQRSMKKYVMFSNYKSKDKWAKWLGIPKVSFLKLMPILNIDVFLKNKHQNVRVFLYKYNSMQLTDKLTERYLLLRKLRNEWRNFPKNQFSLKCIFAKYYLISFNYSTFEIV